MRRLVGWAGARSQALGMSFLLVIFAAAVFWFVAFFIPGRRQAAIDAWHRDLDVRAEIRKEALQRYFVDGLADAETLAAYPTALKVLTTRPAGAGRPAADAGVAAAHLEELFGDFVRIHGVLGVVLWDADGKPCVKTRDFVLEAACLAPAREVVASGAPATGFHLHTASGPVLTFSAPVRSAKGDMRGAVVVAVDPREWLYPLLAQPLAGTSTGEVFLVGRDGADILFLSPLRNRPGVPLTFRRPFAESGLPARAALEGSEIAGPYVDYRGVRVLAGWRRIPPSPWAIVVKVDEEEAIAGFRAGVRRTALAWGSLAVAFLGITWGVWQMRGRRQAVALNESEARYRTLLENIPQGIFMKSRTFRYVSVNENYARDLGIRPEEAVGKVDHDLFPKEHADKYRADDKRVMETAKTEEFEEQYVQGGREKWIHTIKTPVKDRDGEIIGVLGVFWDITERKRAEESIQKLLWAVEQAENAIFMTEPGGVITYVNPAFVKTYGYSKEEAVGKTPRILKSGRYSQAFYERYWQRLLAGESVRQEFVNKRRDGQLVTVDQSVNSVLDSAGKRVGFIAVQNDITERKRAHEALRESEANLRALTEELESRVETRTAELKEANHELEAFSYSVSHDLRAPLRAVDGFSRILLEEHAKQLDGEGKRLLDVVRTNTRQMGQLIDDLLSFSRVGRQEMARSSVDMEALAKAAFLDLLAANERVSFSVGPLPCVDADSSLMRQVWTNLISNSLKFTRPKAERIIEIAGRTEPGRVVYWVKDNGVGFDMAYANKLFGVFQRLHSSKEFEGTGVGLALVQRIVHRHGGEVWADGKIGEGAAFSFSLPRPGGNS